MSMGLGAKNGAFEMKLSLMGEETAPVELKYARCRPRGMKEAASFDSVLQNVIKTATNKKQLTLSLHYDKIFRRESGALA